MVDVASSVGSSERGSEPVEEALTAHPPRLSGRAQLSAPPAGDG